MSQDKLDKESSSQPEEFQIHMDTGKIHFNSKLYLEAIEDFSQCAEICNLYNLKNYSIHMLELATYLASSNLKYFEQHLEDLDSYEDARIFYELAILIVQQNEQHLVENYGKKLQVKLLTDRHFLNLCMNNFEEAEGDLKFAQKLLKDIEQQSIDHAYVEFLLGSLYLLIFEKDLYNKSMNHLKKAYQIMTQQLDNQDEGFILTIQYKIEELNESYKEVSLSQEDNPFLVGCSNQSSNKKKQITYLGRFGSASKNN